MNTVSISLKLPLPLINMQCSMKEHCHPRDMIFIVGAGGRVQKDGRTEVREVRLVVKRDISVMSRERREQGAMNKRQPKRRRYRLEHLFSVAYLPLHMRSPQGCIECLPFEFQQHTSESAAVSAHRCTDVCSMFEPDPSPQQK